MKEYSLSESGYGRVELLVIETEADKFTNCLCPFVFIKDRDAEDESGMCGELCPLFEVRELTDKSKQVVLHCGNGRIIDIK